MQKVKCLSGPSLLAKLGSINGGDKVPASVPAAGKRKALLIWQLPANHLAEGIWLALTKKDATALVAGGQPKIGTSS